MPTLAPLFVAAMMAAAAQPPAAAAGNAAPATALAAAPAATNAASPIDNDPGDKVVCRTLTPTGSRLGGTRVCRTQRQWSLINRDAKDLVDDAQQNSLHYQRQYGGG